MSHQLGKWWYGEVQCKLLTEYLELFQKNYLENESSARAVMMVVWQGPIQSLV